MAGDSHTFLFIDVVGFTALADIEGDGRALEVVLELQRRVGVLLAEHTAEQVKSTGDGLMLRAADAAQAIRLGVRAVDELEQVPGFPPVRVGIHSGRVSSTVPGRPEGARIPRVCRPSTRPAMRGAL